MTRSGDTWKSGVPGEPGNLKVGSIAGWDILWYRDAVENFCDGSMDGNGWVFRGGARLFTWVAREVPAAESGCRATRLGENIEIFVSFCTFLFQRS